MTEWLGEGLAECVHWRRGALMYMYIATMVQDEKHVLGMLSQSFNCGICMWAGCCARSQCSRHERRWKVLP